VNRDREHEQVAVESRVFGWLVLLIVFIGGMASIGIEIAASRLLGPYFGTSTFIWANLIGLTLLYLSIGYYFGGRVADRWPSATLLLCITAVAGFGTGLIPPLSRPILQRSLEAFSSLSVGAFYGSLVGVILLFALPVTLLGFVSPFAIRLRMSRVDAAGNTAGSLYALSTIGSIVGSFLPVLLLIPVVGTYWTFYIFSLGLLVTSALGLALLRSPIAAAGAAALSGAVVAIAVLTSGEVVRPPEFGRLIYEEESEYNYIQVVEQDGKRYLALNEGHAIHSIYDPRPPGYSGPWSYWDYPVAAPFFNPGQTESGVNSLALIGLAGGTIAERFTEAYGPIPIDGVEIDPAIVRVGRQYFDMNEPNLNVIVQDGRYFLRTTTRSYDAVVVDAYHQPYIPFHLTTKEFFQEIDDHLNRNGVAVVNAGRTTTDYRLVDVIASTMRAVFPNVYVVDVEGFTNSIIIATKSPSDIGDLRQNVRAMAPGYVKEIGETMLQSGNVREWTTADPGLVFTDDLAPVERIVDQIIVDAARGR
jgi:spermidine synthase